MRRESEGEDALVGVQEGKLGRPVEDLQRGEREHVRERGDEVGKSGAHNLKGGPSVPHDDAHVLLGRLEVGGKLAQAAVPHREVALDRVLRGREDVTEEGRAVVRREEREEEVARCRVESESACAARLRASARGLRESELTSKVVEAVDAVLELAKNRLEHGRELFSSAPRDLNVVDAEPDGCTHRATSVRHARGTSTRERWTH